MVSTTAGGRPLKSAASCPGATHGGSIDLDAGAIWYRAPEKGGPSSEECAREELSRGKWVRETRSGWANGAQPAGPAPRPPWACTVSVRVGSLGKIDSRSAGSSRDGVATLRGTWAVVRARRPHDWAAPGCEQHTVTWTACDSRRGDGGRAVTCGVIVYPPAGWYTRPPQCCPCGLARACPTAFTFTFSRRFYPKRLTLHLSYSFYILSALGRNCRKAKCTAHSSRQLMCQSSQGPVQSPEAACPLHVAPQPVLEASVVTTVCRDTCSRGTPARRKARSVQGLRERRHCWEIPTRSVPRRHAHLGTRECSQCWSGLIWSNPRGVTAAADAICPRSLWNCFSGTTFLPLKELRQFSTAWARSSVRRAVTLTESNSTPRKEILCTGESLLFSQLTRSPNWLRCRSTKSLWSPNCSLDWARISQSSR